MSANIPFYKLKFAHCFLNRKLSLLKLQIQKPSKNKIHLRRSAKLTFLLLFCERHVFLSLRSNGSYSVY